MRGKLEQLRPIVRGGLIGYARYLGKFIDESFHFSKRVAVLVIHAI